MADEPKVISQRYFVSHLKEINEIVEVTVQEKGQGLIKTLGYFIPATTSRSSARQFLARIVAITQESHTSD